MLRSAILAHVAAAALAAQAAGETTIAQRRLAHHLAHTAAVVVRFAPMTVGVLDTSSALVRAATALDPDDEDAWRLLLRLEWLADKEAGSDEALEQLSRLAPDDDVVRLRRLTRAIDRLQTIEERVAAYRRLLSGESREAIGAPVASRLSLDLALLHRREGDVDAFAAALADAVALDPANRAAAAIAAGFFRMSVDDPHAEAELLVNLLLADPTDVTTQAVLGGLLLEHGAYEGAERMYVMAVSNIQALRRLPDDDLIADLAIAHWANGRSEAALRLIRERQQRLNEEERVKAWNAAPGLDPMERDKFGAPVSPTLATARAAIQVQRGDANADAEVALALQGYREWLEVLDPPAGAAEGAGASAEAAARPRADPLAVAMVRMEMAWVAAWLGRDAGQIRGLLESAQRVHPLDAQAIARFDGWIALREGDPERAAAILAPLAAVDPAAAIGLAEAELLRGRRKDAARAFLAAARLQPGSLIGIWATHRLGELLSPGIMLTDRAARLEALVETVPRTFDRLAKAPSLAVAFNLKATKAVYRPYEPIIVNIEISNQSVFPLAIDREGPIRPQVLLLFETTLSRSDVKAETPSIVIDIDRRLRLEPGERLVIPVDVRRYHLGATLNAGAISGAFVRVRGLLNFLSLPNGTLEPGLLGGQAETGTIRIEGERVSTEWVNRMMDDIREPEGKDDIISFALLGHIPGALKRRITGYESARAALRLQTDPGSRKEIGRLDALLEEHRKLLAATTDAMTQAYAVRDPAVQGWLLGVIPPGELLAPIRAMARKSENELVRTAYLLYQLDGPRDPMLEAGMRSEHPTVRRIAETFDELFKYLPQTELEPDA